MLSFFFCVVGIFSERVHGVEEAKKVIRQAMNCPHGRRALGDLGEVIDVIVKDRTREMTSALGNVISLYPPGSSGRKHIVAAAAGSLSDKSVLHDLGLPRKYVASCVATTPQPPPKPVAQDQEQRLSVSPEKQHEHTDHSWMTQSFTAPDKCKGALSITNEHGRTGIRYTQIGELEGRYIEMFTRSYASAKSGQRERKKGDTLYTEMCNIVRTVHCIVWSVSTCSSSRQRRI